MFSIITNDNQLEYVSGMNSEYPIVVRHINMVMLDVPWHWHEEVEFKYVESGSLRMRTEKDEFILHAGEACFTNMNIMEMSEAMDRTQDTNVITFVFHPALISGHFQSIYEKKYVRPVLTNRQIKVIKITSETESGAAICKGLLKVSRLYDQGNTELQIRNLLSEIWLHLIKEIEIHLNSQPAESLRSKDRIRYMLQYIYTHYAEKITLEDIAASANISEREALRTFKKALDKAPFDYLNEYRLDKARELLETSDLTVTEIAVSTGFSDSAYFGKVFRKYFESTPGNYRKKIKGDRGRFSVS